MTQAANGLAPDWRTEESDKARKMWREGVSAREIAAAVGRTRDSVIGHAWRSGFGPHPNPCPGRTSHRVHA